MDGVMSGDFHISFNSSSVLCGRLEVNERLFAMEPRLRFERFTPPARLVLQGLKMLYKVYDNDNLTVLAKQ